MDSRTKNLPQGHKNKKQSKRLYRRPAIQEEQVFERKVVQHCASADIECTDGGIAGS